MLYMNATVALIGGAFLLGLVAIVFVIHASFREVTEPHPVTSRAFPEEYRELLDSKRVSALIRRAQYDVFFRHRLFHNREAALSKWRLSRKERTMLLEMSDHELDGILHAFGEQRKPTHKRVS